jgi:hypothetical protein
VIIDAKAAQQAGEEILKQHSISSAKSPDLLNRAKQTPLSQPETVEAVPILS